MGEPYRRMENILMIELRDMSLRFFHEDRPLIRSATLTVKPGEWIGLTGPSGGGKTLIGLVAAGVIPDIIRADISGEYRMAVGTEPHRTGAAVVFQDPSFQLLANSVREELFYTPRKLDWDPDETMRDFAAIADGLDIGHLLDRNPRELSMGEVQRVAVATALMQRPQVLILDEPTQYIDRYHVERTLEFTAARLKQSPAAVLLIEHHIPLLRRFCDRIYRVTEGRAFPAAVEERSFPSADLSPFTSGEICSALEHVSYAYESGKPVLHDLDLSVRRGESLAILGPNGSGKSTLARIMAGLRSPNSGSATLFGKPRRNGSWHRRIAYVMQNPDRQIFAPTVREECSFGPRNFGIPSERYERLTTELLGAFGLEGFEDRDPMSLSYGEKRRLNIVGAMTSEPDLVILDEPTTGLDFDNQLILLDNIRRWNAQGKTVVLVTHDVAFARAACTRAVFLDNGTVVRDEPLTGIRDEDVVALYA